MFNPDLNTPPNTACFGRVLFDIQVGLPQYSAPYIAMTNEGAVLMTGSDPGILSLYGDLEQGKTGSLTLIDGNYGSLDFGNRSVPALTDLDHDGKYELIAGNQRGGLELFHTEITVGTTGITEHQDNPEKPYYIMYSNAENMVVVAWNSIQPGNIEIIDTYGRLMIPMNDQPDFVQEINLESLLPGIYFLRLQLENRTWVEKIMDAR